MDRGREGGENGWMGTVGTVNTVKYRYSNTDTAKYELKNLGCGYLGIQCTNNSCHFSAIEILHDKVLGKESKEWK